MDRGTFPYIIHTTLYNRIFLSSAALLFPLCYSVMLIFLRAYAVHNLIPLTVITIAFGGFFIFQAYVSVITQVLLTEKEIQYTTNSTKAVGLYSDIRKVVYTNRMEIGTILTKNLFLLDTHGNLLMKIYCNNFSLQDCSNMLKIIHTKNPEVIFGDYARKVMNRESIVNPFAKDT